MNLGFWEKLPKPFLCLAPLADVTDVAFRQLIAKYSRHGEPGGGPDVFWTEFVSADGLASAGREVLKYDLGFTEAEHPIVAQLFGANPEHMYTAAALCAELGFDGIDINMGCPDRSIEKQGAGAAMIKNPSQAKKIIEAARRGAPTLPISVKTRVGYNKVEIDEWIPELLACDLAALTIHARTRKEMSLVPARWEHVSEVVRMRDRLGVGTKIIGNGDVVGIDDARKKAEETGCDGVMLGRAIFGNPWLFDETKQMVGVKEKLQVMVEHTKLFEKLLGRVKNFAIMKKHYKAYVHGFDGAKELRMKLMDASSAEAVSNLVDNFLAENQSLL